jgi:hypothetical protein
MYRVQVWLIAGHSQFWGYGDIIRARRNRLQRLSALQPCSPATLLESSYHLPLSSSLRRQTYCR